MSLAANKRFPGLDGLRGVAILSVFLYHYWPAGQHSLAALVFHAGWAGVDLFFALSGFLITGILFDTTGSSNFFSVFYARRSLRLLPVYLAAVIVVIVGTHFLRGFDILRRLPVFFYATNITDAADVTSGEFGPNFVCSHFWSLAVEEQFYSIWPLVVYFVRDRDRLLKISGLGIVAAPLLRLLAAALHAKPTILYEQLPMRMDALLVGSFVALALRGPTAETWLSTKKIKPVVWIGALGYLICIAVGGSTSYYLPWMSTVGFSFTAALSGCLLLLSMVPGTLTSRITINPILRFFGRYSYGLYVWHYLIHPVTLSWLAGARRLAPGPVADLGYTLFCLILFTAASVLSYHMLEAPFLKLKNRFQYAQHPPVIRTPNRPHQEALASPSLLNS